MLMFATPPFDDEGGVAGRSTVVSLSPSSSNEDAEESRLGVDIMEQALSAPELRRRWRFSSMLAGESRSGAIAGSSAGWSRIGGETFRKAP